MKTLIAIALAAAALAATPAQAGPIGTGIERQPSLFTPVASRQSCRARCRARYGDYQPCERGETRMCSVELGQCYRRCR